MILQPEMNRRLEADGNWAGSRESLAAGSRNRECQLPNPTYPSTLWVSNVGHPSPVTCACGHDKPVISGFRDDGDQQKD